MKIKNIIWVVLWIFLMILGIIGVIQRFSDGLKVTNLGNHVVWGQWIAMDIYFIGLSAGAFLLSSLVYVFRIKIFEKIGKLALTIAIISLICGIMSAWVDIGHMERFTKVFINPDFRSLLTIIIWLYTIYFFLICFEIYYAFRSDLVQLSQQYKFYKIFTFGNIDLSENRLLRDKRILGILGTIGIPLAIAFHGGFGSLFAVVGANPFWHTAIYPLYFLVGALTSGCALLTTIVAFLWDEKNNEEYKQTLFLLGRITLGLLAFDVLLEFADYSISLWGGIPSHVMGFKMILFGDNWWVFWIVHVLFGVIIPSFILITSPRSRFVGLAAAFIATTFMAVRLNIVIPGLSFERVSGLESSFIQPRLSYYYFPSLNEWLVGIFIVTFGIGLFFIAKKLFPLTTSVEKFKL